MPHGDRFLGVKDAICLPLHGFRKFLLRHLRISLPVPAKRLCIHQKPQLLIPKPCRLQRKKTLFQMRRVAIIVHLPLPQPLSLYRLHRAELPCQRKYDRPHPLLLPRHNTLSDPVHQLHKESPS